MKRFRVRAEFDHMNLPISLSGFSAHFSKEFELRCEPYEAQTDEQVATGVKTALAMMFNLGIFKEVVISEWDGSQRSVATLTTKDLKRIKSVTV